MKSEDLRVSGPGSPLSMQKFTDAIDAQTPKEKQPEVIVMIDQSGIGQVHDNPELTNIMISDRVEQAHYWRDNFWNGKQISAYLYRYIYYMMMEEQYDQSKFKYPTDKSIADAITSGALKETDEEFITIKNYLEWMKNSSEITHIVGMVQLLGGCLKQAKKQGHSLRFFIELPETGFHPKRQQKIMRVIKMIGEDYGYSPEKLAKELEEVRKDLEDE